jgi:Fe-S-cluster containining protein
MTENGAQETSDLPAGDFSPWLADMQDALVGQRDSKVPCGSCTACCTASQFVHIAPDETDTLSHIPTELLFQAPRLPPGHRVLGYDEHGHCPMLKNNQCSIYEFRPRACRTYDCRVFPATGVVLTGVHTQHIARRSDRWRFTFSSGADRAEYDALHAAARFLQEHSDEIVGLPRAMTETQRAIIAIEIHDAFVQSRNTGDHSAAHSPSIQEIEDVVRRREPTPDHPLDPA